MSGAPFQAPFGLHSGRVFIDGEKGSPSPEGFVSAPDRFPTNDNCRQYGPVCESAPATQRSLRLRPFERPSPTPLWPE